LKSGSPDSAIEIDTLEPRMMIDHRWQNVAETALKFVSRFQPTTGAS
jgi:hypothetical protein